MKITDIAFVVMVVVLLSSVLLTFDIMTVHMNCLKAHDKP